MKYATLALMGIGLAIGSSIVVGQEPAKGEPELKTLEQRFSYAIGLGMARQMKEQGIELDPNTIAKGLKDGLAGKPALTDQQVVEAIQQFQQKMMAKQGGAPGGAGGADAEKTLKEGQAFLAANKTKPGVTTLPSGLQYKVLKSGTGKTPTLKNSVIAHYKGTLIDGTEFDSSFKRGEPAEFRVDEVIPGWTEALQLMKVGDKWQLFIPANLAYRDQRRGAVITPNSALVFDIELLDVK